MLEQATAGRGRLLHSCEHERHIFSGACQFRQPLRSHAWIAQAHDAIVAGVPLGQLRLDHAKGFAAFIDGE